MGVFSKFHRFREAGEDVNAFNAEEYGMPVRSLFTTSKVFTLHKKTDITDANEQLVYHSESKFWTLHDDTTVTDANGNMVAHIRKKFFTLHERHFVEMADGLKFQISNELFHLIKDITNIEELGWQLRGNIMAMNFQLFDHDNNIIAVISQKMISLHDKYCVDIYREEAEPVVVAILVTLQHMIKDRENAQASSSSFSSSSD